MAQHNISSRIILLNDTKANWDTKADKFILLKGEIGIETDTKKFKIGDGTSTWAELDYYAGSSDSGDITIPTKLADLLEDETHRTVTDEEKETWNSKAETSDIPTKLPNPHSLTIKQNGDTKGTYDGSSEVEINLDGNLDGTPTNMATTNTEQTFTAKKIFDNIVQLNNSIIDKDGNFLVEQKTNYNMFGDLLKLFYINSSQRPVVTVKDGGTQHMAFLRDIPEFSDKRLPEVPSSPDEEPSEVFQASIKLGKYKIKFGVDYLEPKKETVTTKTITFDEPFEQYCAGVVTGCSSASTLRTTNLNDTVPTTGITVAIYRTNTTATYFSWIAIGI